MIHRAIHAARWALLAAAILLPTTSARAVAVNNYNWLQLPANDVTPITGSFSGNTTVGFGENSDFRWGDYVWLPSMTMTNSGADMYYAGVQFDQARPVDSVRQECWTSEMTLSQYYIDSSNDGTNWTNIAVEVPGSTPATGSVSTVAVTPGNYQYVRVRFEGPDYTAGGYGGPGLHIFEALGSGDVASDQVNWANAANFGTTIAHTNLPTYNSTAYTDGKFDERAGTGFWTGTSGNWADTGAYTTVNLNGTRLIGSATALWSDPYGGNAFDIQYSTDGVTFFNAASPSTTQFSTANHPGATRVSFDPVIATHIRMINASGAYAGFTLMNQLLLHGPNDGVLASNPLDNGVLNVGSFDANEVVTYTDAITLENIGAPGSAIAIFDVSITGADAAQFDITDFAQTILLAGEDVAFDLELTTLLDGTYNATVTFTTNLGDFTFDINATIVPEPSTGALLGLGAVAFAWTLRRRGQRIVRQAA